jgi:DNA-binding CsgD family transcriptional regulator
MMIAQGRTAEEISKAMNITKRAAEMDVMKLRRRLNARDRAHLVTRALQAKEITLAELVG